jgi:predicted ATPase/DNA-binding SARP family transcriptional activator
MLRLHLFGTPRIERDGQIVAPGRTKAVALLAYLVVTGQPHERELLATIFWPELDLDAARNGLRRELSVLRTSLGAELLVADRRHVARNPAAVLWLDIAHFGAQVGRVSAHGHRQGDLCPSCADALRQAVGLYTDDFLLGLPLPECPVFDEWQFFQREALRDQLARALQWLGGWHQQRGEYEPAITLARRWLQLDQLHEPAHRALMELYAASGRQSAALRQYQECVRLLDAELGATPQAETTALAEAIQARRVTPRPAASPPADAGAQPSTVAPSDPRARQHLPSLATPLLGREQELDNLHGYLASPHARLITLVGPGGIGKTSLAIEVAARAAAAYPDGVVFANLQPIATPDQLVAAIADAAGCRLSGSATPRVQLLSHFRDKALLLLLDNFEQLLAGADLLSELLAAAPGLRLLVTSREVLNLQEEWSYPLGGLAVPPEGEAATALEQYAAVRLFAERARRAWPAFTLADEQGAVARIGRLVEGMPLALELAAAWRGVLSCAAIADAIAQNLTFLVAKDRNRPERHRSIRAVFEHSWARLDPETQLLLVRLTVFRGGFTHEAAVAVVGATPASLATLVDTSLVRLESSGRYQIHELLRQYAEEQLYASAGEAARARQAHSRYFLTFLARRSETMLNGRDPRATAEIAAERDNVRVAWQYGSASADIPGIAGALGALASYYLYRGPYDEGVALCAEAVRGLRSTPPDRARDETLAETLHEQAWLLFNTGQLAEARAALDETIVLMGGPDAPPTHENRASDPLAAKTFLALLEGDYATAGRLASTYLQRSQARGAAVQYPFAWFLLARVAFGQGLYAQASRAAAQALATVRTVGDRWFEAYVLDDLGQIARALGDYTLAREHFRASYAIRELFDDPEGRALALYHEGLTALLEGNPDEAGALFERSLAIYTRRGDRNGLAGALHGMGRVRLAGAAPGEAAWLYRGAIALAREAHNASLLLALLVSVSELLLAVGQPTLAWDLLMLVVRHPASERETSDRAQQLLLANEHVLMPADGAGGAAAAPAGLADPVVAHVLVVLETLARPRPVDAAARPTGLATAPQRA